MIKSSPHHQVGVAADGRCTSLVLVKCHECGSRVGKRPADEKQLAVQKTAAFHMC